MVARALEETARTSALALTEALALVDRLTDDGLGRGLDIEDELRLQWDRYHVIPLTSAASTAHRVDARQPLRLADALHLAAADRLPRPLRYVTLDPAQIPVALSLGFDVDSQPVELDRQLRSTG